MIEAINTFNIDPIGNGYNKQLSADELSIFAIWLTKAYHDADIKPLWFAKTGVFARRDGFVIKLKDMDGAMSLDTVLNFLKAISTQAEHDGKLHGRIYPTHDEYNADKQWTSHIVKEKDGILGYYDQNDRSFLPVALRYTDDMHVWYGIKGSQDKDSDFLTIRFKFDNLSLAQI